MSLAFAYCCMLFSNRKSGWTTRVTFFHSESPFSHEWSDEDQYWFIPCGLWWSIHLDVPLLVAWIFFKWPSSNLHEVEVPNFVLHHNSYWCIKSWSFRLFIFLPCFHFLSRCCLYIHHVLYILMLLYTHIVTINDCCAVWLVFILSNCSLPYNIIHVGSCTVIFYIKFLSIYINHYAYNIILTGA